jgi:hypothetical protein
MRVAMLLASLSNNNVIEMRHWARAQQIAERWRRSLHNLIETVQHESTASREADLETKVIRAIGRLGQATIVDIQRRALKGASTDELERILDSLERHKVVTAELTRKGTKRYSVVKTNSRKVEKVESRKDTTLSTIQTDIPPEPPPDEDETKSRNENTNFYGSTFLPFYYSTETLQEKKNGNGHVSPRQSDYDHDMARFHEVEQSLDQGDISGAKRAASRIRGNRMRKEADDVIAQHEVAP